jgi:hypothetical protein
VTRDLGFSGLIRRTAPFNRLLRHAWADELEIKDTTESDKSASYLDILLNIDTNGRLTTSLFDKRDDFDFAIVNFPFLCSNIPLSPAYGVYISELIRYARACFAYEDFLKRGKLLTHKLMLQGYESRHHFANSTVAIMTFFAIKNITGPYAE